MQAKGTSSNASSAHFQASPRNHSTVLRALTQGRPDDMGSPEQRFSKILLENVGTKKNTEDGERAF